MVVSSCVVRRAMPLGLAVGSILLAGTSRAALVDNLELYYSFDNDTIAAGGINDLSGNNRDGSPRLSSGGLSFSADVAGPLGGGLSLSNNDTDLIDAAWTGIAGNTDRTVSFWTKKTGTTDTTVFVEWGVNTNGNRFSVTQEISANQPSTGASLPGGVRTELQGDYRSTPAAGPNIADGNWHHVAVVLDYDGVGNAQLEEVTMYVDGIAMLAYADNANQQLINTLTTNPVSVAGGTLNGQSRFLNGLIDEVGIWSRALSAQEVADLAAGTVVPEPGSLALLGLGGLMILRRRR